MVSIDEYHRWQPGKNLLIKSKFLIGWGGGSLWLYGEFSIKSDKKVLMRHWIFLHTEQYWGKKSDFLSLKNGQMVKAETYRKIPLIPSIDQKPGVFQAPVHLYVRHNKRLFQMTLFSHNLKNFYLLWASELVCLVASTTPCCC